MNEKISKKIKFLKILVKSIVAIGLSIYAVLEYQENSLQKRIEAKFGMFGKQKDVTILNPVIVLGSNAAQDFATGTLKVGRGPVNPLNVRSFNGQLFLDIKINGSRGDGVAVLSGRTWKIVNSDGIDYNNDEKGFEIITSEGRVIFQIELRTDTVICNGMFCAERGFCVFYTDKYMFQSYNLGPDKRFNLPNEFQVKKMFNYPRNEFLGERDTSWKADIGFIKELLKPH